MSLKNSSLGELSYVYRGMQFWAERPKTARGRLASLARVVGNEEKECQERGVTMTTEVGTNGATTLSRTNFSGYVGHVTLFCWMFTIACV